MSSLKEKFETEIKPAMRKKFGYKNVMQIPRLNKVIISMGIAEITKDKNAIADAREELALLSGQKPIERKAKKSIANFKLREGQPLGLKVTIRGQRMYDFLTRFCHIVSPRIRDFRGFNRKGDGQGNVSIGLEDQQMFPEINLDKVKRNQGMNVTFVTNAQTDDEGLELLTLLGIPFKKQK